LIPMVLAGMTLFSCSKRNTDGGQLITGKWELRQQIGGIAAKIDYPPGNGNLCVFNADNSFRTVHADTTTSSGTYQIKTSAHAGDWLLVLQSIANGQLQTTTDSVRFANARLIFLPRETCCDMATTYFERLQ